jgi:hypothetical protein
MRNEMEGNCFAPGGDCSALPPSQFLLLDGDSVITRFAFKLSIFKCLMALLGLLLGFRLLALVVLGFQVGHELS